MYHIITIHKNDPMTEAEFEKYQLELCIFLESEDRSALPCTNGEGDKWEVDIYAGGSMELAKSAYFWSLGYLAHLDSTPNPTTQVDELTAANESMQEDAVQNTIGFNNMLKANRALTDENARLRAALDEIANGPFGKSVAVKNVARAALKGE